MKQYFYHDGKIQHGPFSFDELKQQNITKDTKIWYEGMQQWQNANELSEFNDFFIVKVPPPLNTNTPIAPPLIVTVPPSLNTNTPIAPPTVANDVKKEIIVKPTQQKSNVTKIVLISLVSVVGLVFMIIIGLNIMRPNYDNDPSVIKTDEAIMPSVYLDASGNYKENFWGDAITIEGYIKNKAVYTDYRNVVLRVTFYDKNDNEIESKDYIIKDYFLKSSQKDFKLKISFPNGAKSCGWDAVNASPY